MNLINKLKVYIMKLINFIDNRVFSEENTTNSLYGILQRIMDLGSRYIDTIGYLVIPILALALRLHNYNILPFHNATADEFAFAWCGWSLLHGQKPVGWSWFPVYQSQLIEWRGNPYPIVSPWFDHPPLFGLIVGLACIIGGAPTMFDCTLECIRLPSIIFGTLSTILVYLVGSRFYKKSIGIIAAVLYATIPVIVITNRLAVAENMLTFLLLLAIYSTLRYIEGNGTKYLSIVLICAPMAILTKLTGVSVTIIASSILIAHKYRKESGYVILSGIIAILGYLIYGLLLDWHLFIAVQKAQGRRFSLSYKFFFDILTVGSSINYTWIDGWIIWSWIALLYASTKDNKQILSIGAGVYLLTIILSSGFFVYYWYILPLFPFFCLACGKYVNDLIERPNLIFFFIFFVSTWWPFLGFYSDELYQFIGIRIVYIWITRGIVSGLFGGYFLHFIFRGKRTKAICSSVTFILFLTYVALNIFIVIYALDILPLLAHVSRDRSLYAKM